MNANGEFEKLGPVIRCLPEGVTEHIRDPKVIYTQGKWQMLLGAQTLAHQGRLAVYHSDDLLHWHFDKLYGDELGDYGYMWECPDWFELQGEAFLCSGHKVSHRRILITPLNIKIGSFERPRMHKVK
ncbi:hypothetical protein WI666_02060 [Vibrio cholerae]